jgi:hypothetical protein
MVPEDGQEEEEESNSEQTLQMVDAGPSPRAFTEVAGGRHYPDWAQLNGKLKIHDFY